MRIYLLGTQVLFGDRSLFTEKAPEKEMAQKRVT